MKKIKILAAASIGGHWIQLLRITGAMDNETDIIYLSTHSKCATMVTGHTFYQLKDFSRWDFYKLVPAFFSALRLIRKESPDVVISTGAAPGLICLFAAKILGKKTVWIDSIANVQHLSFSGRIASIFVSRTYTQWKNLSGKHIYFAGNIFG